MNSSPRLIAIDAMSSDVYCLMLSKTYLIELVAFFNISGHQYLKDIGDNNEKGAQK